MHPVISSLSLLMFSIALIYLIIIIVFLAPTYLITKENFQKLSSITEEQIQRIRSEQISINEASRYLSVEGLREKSGLYLKNTKEKIYENISGKRINLEIYKKFTNPNNNLYIRRVSKLNSSHSPRRISLELDIFYFLYIATIIFVGFYFFARDVFAGLLDRWGRYVTVTAVFAILSSYLKWKMGGQGDVNKLVQESLRYLSTGALVSLFVASLLEIALQIKRLRKISKKISLTCLILLLGAVIVTTFTPILESFFQIFENFYYHLSAMSIPRKVISFILFITVVITVIRIRKRLLIPFYSFGKIAFNIDILLISVLVLYFLLADRFLFNEELFASVILLVWITTQLGDNFQNLYLKKKLTDDSPNREFVVFTLSLVNFIYLAYRTIFDPSDIDFIISGTTCLVMALYSYFISGPGIVNDIRNFQVNLKIASFNRKKFKEYVFNEYRKLRVGNG